MSRLILYSFIFVGSVFISSVSQLMLKKSALLNHTSRIKEYLNPLVIPAYAMFLSASFITMLAYRYVPLSLGSILESTGYIFVTVLGMLILKEKISIRKLIGMSVIFIGILVFSL